MVTGKREPTGVELHMTQDEAKLVVASLRATAHLCNRLIACGPGGEMRPGSLLDQLPDVVIRALREGAGAHSDLAHSIAAIAHEPARRRE